MVSGAGGRGETIAAARVKLAAGARAFASALPLDSLDAVREVFVQVQIAGAGDGRVSGSGSAAVPEAGSNAAILPPLLYRGSPGAAAEFRPVAYPQFRRAEILRAEARPGVGVSGMSARLLDRTGKPLAVPVSVTERSEADSGRRWLVAEVGLAPLAAGEYVLALSVERQGERQEVLTAFRVVR